MPQNLRVFIFEYYPKERSAEDEDVAAKAITMINSNSVKTRSNQTKFGNWTAAVIFILGAASTMKMNKYGMVIPMKMTKRMRMIISPWVGAKDGGG